MEHWNSTLGSGFILMGILNDSLSPELICATITVLYMLALASNCLLLLAIPMDARLHVPMYLLLSQLSLMDLMLTSVVIPKMLVDYLRGKNAISFEGCALQMFLVLTLGGAEGLLLAFMAYDRYVAVCHPLRYPVLMNWKACCLMSLASWMGGVAGCSVCTKLLLLSLEGVFIPVVPSRRKSLKTLSSGP